MSSTGTDKFIDLMEETTMPQGVGEQYSFFWDEELANSSSRLDVDTLGPTEARTPITSDEGPECRNHLQGQKNRKISGAEAVHKPNVLLSDRSVGEKNAMEPKTGRKKVKKAGNMQNKKQTKTSKEEDEFNEIDSKSGNSNKQPMKYYDVDPDDDATLWMLMQLSRNKYREKSFPSTTSNLRERILIRNTAERAFNYLFPPIHE